VRPFRTSPRCNCAVRFEVCRARAHERPRGAAPAGIYDRASRPGATVPGVNVEYEYALAPEVTIDTTAKSVTEAAADVVGMVRRRLRTARHDRPVSRSRGLCGRIRLDEGDSVQKAIGRRAFAYTAKLLSEVAAPAEGAAAWCAEARERMVQRTGEAAGAASPSVLAPRDAYLLKCCFMCPTMRLSCSSSACFM
jgi:hypothetical protein